MRTNPYSYAVAVAIVANLVLGGCAPVSQDSQPVANVAGSASAAQPAAPAKEETVTTLAGPIWLVTEISGEKIVVPAGARQPFIEFDAAAKSASGFSGCNTFRGPYESEGASLKFGPLMTTKMACGGDRDKIEFAMHTALGKVTAYSIDGGTLDLKAADGAVLIRLQAQPKSPQ